MPEESDKDDDAAEAEERRLPKFIYECVRCGHSCADRNFVEITLADLRTWAEDQTLAAIFPYLRLALLGRPYIDIILASDEGLAAAEEGEAELAGCPMYDADNKLCNIYHSMPLHCQAFPLAYNGTNYYVRDKECKGLGQGVMTRDGLAAHRDAARREFEARREAAVLMPILQGIFTRFFYDASSKVVEGLSEEDRANLEDILRRDRARDEGGEDGGGGDGGGG